MDQLICPLASVVSGTVENLCDAVDHQTPELPAADIAHTLAALRDARQMIALTYELAEKELLAKMEDKTLEVPGLGVIEAKASRRRTQWNTPDLLRVVNDTRVVNPDTGEVMSQLDKVTTVWNLGAPRVTVLKEWDIQCDEFCKEDPAKWSVMLPGRKT